MWIDKESVPSPLPPNPVVAVLTNFLMLDWCVIFLLTGRTRLHAPSRQPSMASHGSTNTIDGDSKFDYHEVLIFPTCSIPVCTRSIFCMIWVVLRIPSICTCTLGPHNSTWAALQASLVEFAKVQVQLRAARKIGVWLRISFLVSCFVCHMILNRPPPSRSALRLPSRCQCLLFLFFSTPILTKAPRP